MLHYHKALTPRRHVLAADLPLHTSLLSRMSLPMHFCSFTWCNLAIFSFWQLGEVPLCYNIWLCSYQKVWLFHYVGQETPASHFWKFRAKLVNRNFIFGCLFMLELQVRDCTPVESPAQVPKAIAWRFYLPSNQVQAWRSNLFYAVCPHRFL